jgi:uncharacterized protein
MNETKAHTPGSFCWADLATNDPKAAKAFYENLFGWTSEDIPMGDDQFYTMLNIGGKNVAALYKLNEQQLSQGVPPHWLSYISVANAEETTTKVETLGGKVILPAFDVFDVGRMAVLQDPTEAVFAIWQPIKHIGAQLINQPRTMCWNELNTKNIEAAKAFYTKLFDWHDETKNYGQYAYTEFFKDGKPVAGMMQITEEWGDVPPHWMVYFAVEDCDQSAQRAEALGGKICVQPTDIPQVGRFSVITDPDKATFSIIQLKGEAATG